MPFRSIFFVCCALLCLSVNLRAQPNFKYVKEVGFATAQSGPTLQVDAVGSQYIWGSFNDTFDLDPGPGTNLAYPKDPVNGRDFYIIKLNKNGDFAWGGRTDFAISDLEIDQDQNIVFVAGFYGDSVDVNPGINDSFIKAYSFKAKQFVSKWDSSGHLQWVYYPEVLGLSTVATDAANQVLITGGFLDTLDFDPGPSVALLGALRGSMFLVKLDKDGKFRWVRHNEGLWSIKTEVDDTGNILHFGTCFDSVDVDPGPDTVMRVANFSNGSFFGDDHFKVVSKLDSLGNFKWAQLLNSNDYYSVTNMTADRFGNVIVAGSYFDTLFCDDASGKRQLLINPDGIMPQHTFLLKFRSDGSVNWADDLGYSGTQFIWPLSSFEPYPVEVRTDTAANIYLASSFRDSADFDPGPGIHLLKIKLPMAWYSLATSAACFHPDGSLAWARSFSSKQLENFGTGIDLDGAGNLYVAGVFRDTVDFDPDTSVVNVSPTNGFSSAPFLLKLGQCENPRSYSSSQTCDSFFYNGYMRRQSGTYYQRISNGSCDSIAVLNLIIDTANANVLQVGNSLYAQSATGVFQWIDCDDMSAIPGANSGIFTPAVSGSYALMVTDNRCVALSPCFSVIGTAIPQGKKDDIRCYPNPTTGAVMLDLGTIRKNIQLEVHDYMGRLEQVITSGDDRMLSFTIAGPDGLYFLSITDEAGNKRVIKLIKAAK